MEAVFLLGVGYTRATVTAITCLTLAVGFSGFAISGKCIFAIVTSWRLATRVIVPYWNYIGVYMDIRREGNFVFLEGFYVI